jgi:hypothetical protein
MLTINGSRICGGTDETIVQYIPFDEDNSDSLKSNKTESELDNCTIVNHVPAVYLTNFQVFNFINTRREEMCGNYSAKSNLLNHNEDHLPNKTSELNDDSLNILCHSDEIVKSINDTNSTTKPKVQQSTPTERKSTLDIVSNKSNWDIFTNSSTDKNDSHILMTSTSKNNDPCINHGSVNIYTDEIVHYVTTPSFNTNHSVPGNQHKTLTRSNFENLPGLSTEDRNVVGMVLSTTPRNHIQITSKLTETVANYQHIKPQNKSSKNCIINHHDHVRLFIRVH